MREKKSRQPEHLSASLSGRPTTPEPIGDVTAEGKLIPHSGRIVIRPAIPEWEESAPDYEELIDALGERSIDVDLAEIKGIPSGADLPEFAPIAFSIYVGIEKITDASRKRVERTPADRAQIAVEPSGHSPR